MMEILPLNPSLSIIDTLKPHTNEEFTFTR